jgi:formiminotetrahydrofolate cyclodeaminase
MADELSDITLADFLDRLDSADPTPGGGGAAAVAGAMAAALVSMVCRLTVGREKFAAVEAEARRILEESERLRAELQQGIQADALAYEQVMAAYRLPRGTDEEKAVRSQGIQAALRAAAQPPLEMAAACGQVLELAEAGVDILNPGPISDIEVAAHLALAGLRSALANVEINRRGLKDSAEAQELAALMDELSAGREGQAERIAERARARLP